MLLKFFWCLNIIYCSNYERRVPCGGDHGSEWVMMPEHQGEEDSCYAVYITWSDVGYAARSWHDAEAKCLEKVALTNSTALSPSNALVMQPGPDMMLRPSVWKSPEALTNTTALSPSNALVMQPCVLA